MAVEISTNPSFRAGKPQRVGPLPDSQRDFPTIAWDASADGKFLMAARAKGRPESFTVVLNWQAGLKK
jgi:hypothetical protein